MAVSISDSLMPTTVDTPVDSRTVVSAVADIANIELPYVGMRVYCRANGKEYRILTLKVKTIGALSVANAAVDTYEEIFSGDYDDLTGKPTIPLLLSDLAQDSTHQTVTEAEKSSWSAKSDFSGDYDDLSNKPTIPTALSDLANDSTHRVVTDAEKLSWSAKSDFSGSYNDLSNKPTLFDGDYDSLSNKPTLFSGDYDDLSNKPSLPSALSDLTGFSDLSSSLSALSSRLAALEENASSSSSSSQGEWTPYAEFLIVGTYADASGTYYLIPNTGAMGANSSQYIRSDQLYILRLAGVQVEVRRYDANAGTSSAWGYANASDVTAEFHPYSPNAVFSLKVSGAGHADANGEYPLTSGTYDSTSAVFTKGDYTVSYSDGDMCWYLRHNNDIIYYVYSEGAAYGQSWEQYNWEDETAYPAPSTALEVDNDPSSSSSSSYSQSSSSSASSEFLQASSSSFSSESSSEFSSSIYGIDYTTRLVVSGASLDGVNGEYYFDSSRGRYALKSRIYYQEYGAWGPYHGDYEIMQDPYSGYWYFVYYDDNLSDMIYGSRGTDVTGPYECMQLNYATPNPPTVTYASSSSSIPSSSSGESSESASSESSSSESSSSAQSESSSSVQSSSHQSAFVPYLVVSGSGNGSFTDGTYYLVMGNVGTKSAVYQRQDGVQILYDSNDESWVDSRNQYYSYDESVDGSWDTNDGESPAPTVTLVTESQEGSSSESSSSEAAAFVFGTTHSFQISGSDLTNANGLYVWDTDNHFYFNTETSWTMLYDDIRSSYVFYSEGDDEMAAMSSLNVGQNTDPDDYLGTFTLTLV